MLVKFRSSQCLFLVPRTLQEDSGVSLVVINCSLSPRALCEQKNVQGGGGVSNPPSWHLRDPDPPSSCSQEFESPDKVSALRAQGNFLFQRCVPKSKNSCASRQRNFLAEVPGGRGSRTIPVLKVGHTLPPGGLRSYFFRVSYLLFARPPPSRGVGSVRSGKLPLRRRRRNFFGLFSPFFPNVLVIFPRVTLGRPPRGGMVTCLLFFGGVT